MIGQMSTGRFYMCYVEGSDGGKHYRHTYRYKAEEEAERLATLPKNLGKAVYIMTAEVACVAPPPGVQWYLLTHKEVI